MPRRFASLCVFLATSSVFLVGGCPELGNLLPRSNIVTVEVFNDTDFAVQPNIRYDDDPGFLASLFPADRLETGLIQAGDAVTYNFDCDELGLIFSDEAEQVTILFGTYVADATDKLEREKDFDCGDTVRFRFVGEAVDFGVIVSVNGRIVD